MWCITDFVTHDKSENILKIVTALKVTTKHYEKEADEDSFNLV